LTEAVRRFSQSMVKLARQYQFETMAEQLQKALDAAHAE
jgi:hypothetical protein